MVLAADTWGISGPTFLVAYLVLVLVVWGATLIVRAALRSGGGAYSHTDRLAESPADVAYLNEGPTLTVYAVLAGLRAAKLLAPTESTSPKGPRALSSARTKLRATGKPPAAGIGPMERAVYQAAARGVEPSAIRNEPAVVAELDGTRARLTAAGLLALPAWRARYRLTALGMIAVTVLGLVRLAAGTANGKPVGYLVGLLLISAFVTVVLLLQAPRQTGTGKRALRQLRTSRRSLSPKMRPDWTAHGAAGAGLSVALFGVGAVWASDPKFAAGLGLTNPSASSGRGGGGGGCGGGGGGGGGCGG